MSKTVLITGASGEIGYEISKIFFKDGCNLILTYNKHEIKDVFKGKAEFIKCNMQSENDILSLCDSIKEKKIDILINNAGVSNYKLLTDTNVEDYDNIFNVNMKAPYLITKEVLKGMISKKSGRIINISSIWGVSGASMEVLYSASKAALIGFSKALSKEVGPSGISVNVIAPGVIDTKMNSLFSKEEMEEIKDETSLMKIGSAKDIANMCLYLSGEGGDFITGQVITIDGGFI